MNDMRKLILKKSDNHFLKDHRYSSRGYRTHEKIYKLYWVFHLTDADYWPCVPHGHNDEKGLKLDIITGEVFSDTEGKRVGQVTLKELNKLNADKKFQDFVYQHVAWYRQTFPKTSIRCPEWADRLRVATHKAFVAQIETFVTNITTHLD